MDEVNDVIAHVRLAIEIADRLDLELIAIRLCEVLQLLQENEQITIR